jgi:hypothetical protein
MPTKPVWGMVASSRGNNQRCGTCGFDIMANWPHKCIRKNASPPQSELRAKAAEEKEDLSLIPKWLRKKIGDP